MPARAMMTITMMIMMMMAYSVDLTGLLCCACVDYVRYGTLLMGTEEDDIDRAGGVGYRTLPATLLHDMLVLHGAYRPFAKNVFPNTEAGEDAVADLATAVLADISFILTPEEFNSRNDSNSSARKVVTYEQVQQVVTILEEWREPTMGPGRGEKWYGTLTSFFPLHVSSELSYLRKEWGNPKTLFRSVLVGYDPEGEAAVYDPGPPKMFEHNTFGAAGNILHEHTFPGSLIYQPIEEIRDYFGDDVGLYFAWLGLYTRMLFLQSVFGCITMGSQVYYGTVKDNPLTFSYSIYVGLWSISFLEAWHRRENELRFTWGTQDLSSIETPRPEFIGIIKPQFETGREVLTYKSPATQAAKKTVGVLISFAFIVFTICSALAAQVVRYFPTGCYECPESYNDGSNAGTTCEEYEKVDSDLNCNIFEARKFQLISSLLNLAIIGVYGQIFERIALKLNNWENYRTQSEFDNSLVAKNFLFQFVNNYFVLFYISFLREVKDPISRAAHPCEGGNCLPELQTQLIVVFTGKTIAKQLMYTLKPFVFKAVQTTMGNRHTKQLVKAAAKGQAAIPTEMANAMQEVVKLGGGRNDPTQQLKKLRKIRNPYELQNRLMPYAGTFDDFNDRVIQFGYLVLFAPAYSLAPLLAFINNVIEIRTSGFKMCYAYQRPVWKARSGIGSWMVVLNVLGFLAVITNASMITFVGSQDAESLGLETSGFMIRAQQWQLWMRFVITEHSVLLMRTVILIVSPTLPRCKILLYTIYSTSQASKQASNSLLPIPIRHSTSHSPLQATHRRLYPCLLSFDVTDTLTD